MSVGVGDQLVSAFETKAANEIRNVCLIAHVDHGKTSFADSLLACNGLISSRLAGQMRYMDSRQDEQERGITMKASGVSLLYGPLMVNLLDSPGHVDFSSEVSSALMLSDIGLLLVDAVEGVCSQTQVYLRQALTNGQSVILVINKIDRLRVELKMDASEANTHLTRLLEAVNSCVSQVAAGLSLEDESWGAIEKLEEEWHMDPAKGNVLFASALHSYAFSVDDFAEIWAAKLKMDPKKLSKSIFGDFCIQGGQIKPDAYSRGKKTVFEQLVLEPLWALHDLAIVEPNLPEFVEKMSKLGVTVKSKRLPDAFGEAMRTWLPLHRATFRACVRCVSALNAFKVPKRLMHVTGKLQDEHPLAESVKQCSPEGITVVYVAKITRIEDRRLAIVRVLSGKLTRNQQLFVLSGRARKADSELLTTEVQDVVMLRGREAVQLRSATAGTVCAIEASGLVQGVTLCSEAVDIGLTGQKKAGEPLVRVTVSAQSIDRMDDLKENLRLLSLLDPSLRVLELDTGELAMVSSGEVHLQKCIKDLHDLGFTELEVSEPIVPFLETMFADEALTNAQVQAQLTECRMSDDALKIALRVVPLPDEITFLLEKSTQTISDMRHGTAEDAERKQLKDQLLARALETLPKLKGSWWYKQSPQQIAKHIDRIWSFGPKRACANLLINNTTDYERRSIWIKESSGELRHLDQNVIAGFELFVTAGPLCHETMRGVAVVMEEFSVDETDAAVAGQLIPAVRQTCNVAAGKGQRRLVAAMYSCLVSTASQALGKVHGVLSQRRAKVLSEDINEATGLFEVNAVMPVVESFQFCDQLRKKTSGLASGHLEFSHWQMIDEDPYWVPTTPDEIEEFGELADSPNHARAYMDAIRRRKGLPTEDLIVVSADKQRNLAKKK